MCSIWRKESRAKSALRLTFGSESSWDLSKQLIISFFRLGIPLRKEAMNGIWSASEPSDSRTKFCRFLKTMGESFCIKKICGIRKPMVTSSLEQKERKTKAMMLSNKTQKQEQNVLGVPQ